MSTIKELNISPVGRVEGDLDVKVYIEDNKVVRAHTMASMFRGFEKIMRGKDYQAGLIVTPRICGICGGSHLYCASSALDTALQTTLPPNALLIRAIAQACETLQSIPRWFYAIFATDLCNKKFAKYPLYDEVCKRFALFKGSSFERGLNISAKPVEIYAIYGGQWPHSSFMVPGGVMCAPTLTDITRSIGILNDFRRNWLESVWLGCTVDRYRQIQSYDDLMAWVEEKEEHRNSDLGLFIRASLEFGLDTFGKGIGRFIATGTYLHKDKYNKPTIEGRNEALISPSGFYDGKNYSAFDHMQVTEHVRHSWYEEQGQKHPWDQPAPSPTPSGTLEETDFSDKYSWSKSPRYTDLTAEAGPLSRCIMYGSPLNGEHQIKDPLFKNIIDEIGPSVFVRSLARVHEAPMIFDKIHEWLGEIDLDGDFYIKPELRDGKGFGATEAARGFLAHWIDIEDGMIKNYQVVTPTAFNIGPGDSETVRGPIEDALIDTDIEDEHDPVEVGIVARSFDSCLVCTVHAHDNKSDKKLAQFEI
ncbi:MAG: nickel-dependent hydrogenase large subunit [Verrucomicrobiales bacterium]|nr:nickel-dependent hydrogenase large subunit [Verrucomicrobiales bacterium]